MTSYIYEGWVRHRRHAPTRHAFRYRVAMLYLDLEQLDEAFDGSWLFRNERPGLASFRRADHLGDPDVPLASAVRDLVVERTGRRPAGRICLLTHPRYAGYVMNPVSFYYCFDETDRVQAIVAEINNTPWGERHCYVLGAGENLGNATTQRFCFAKDFHVSPFMPMNHDYDWRFVVPGEHLAVHMVNLDDGRPCFDASMSLQRRAMTPKTLRRSFFRFPLMTVKVVSAIYWQALRLRLKRTPFYEHPNAEQLRGRDGQST